MRTSVSMPFDPFAQGSPRIRLSLHADRAPASGPRPPSAKADSEPLPAERVSALLTRLPKLEAGEPSPAGPILRENSAPPARPGETIADTFPPAPTTAAAPEQIPGATLEVRRIIPTGEVQELSHISISFSEPMVALGASGEDPPATLQPQPPGRWRWVGTQTLLFEPESGFPKATQYTICVPAHTHAASGATLAEEVRETISTPAPRLIASYPSEVQSPTERPIIALRFDQRVEAEALLEHLQIKPRSIELEPAPVDLDGPDPLPEALEEMLREAENGTVVTLRPSAPLGAKRSVRIVLEAGAPSAEGPIATTEQQEMSFETAGTFEVEKVACGWNNERRPSSPIIVYFSHPPDPEHFDPDSIRVEPSPTTGPSISTSGRQLYINGLKRGSTRYEVTLPADLCDRFGQQLGEEQTVHVETKAAEPSLTSPYEGLVTRLPDQPAEVRVYTVNLTELRVRLYRVQPKNWRAFQVFRREASAKKPPPAPGELVVDRVLRPEPLDDARVESVIDLREALGPDGLGHVLAWIEPQRSLLESLAFWRNQPPGVRCWVQSTRLGLDVVGGQSELVAWVTQLADGRPVEGAQIQLSLCPESPCSDADGLARLPLPVRGPDPFDTVVARRGEDTCLVPSNEAYWSRAAWVREDRAQRLLWHVFDDRGMYRPGERVHLKGWVRRQPTAKGTGLERAEAPEVRWQAWDSALNELGKGRVELSPQGGFDLEIALPETPGLG